MANRNVRVTAVVLNAAVLFAYGLVVALGALTIADVRTDAGAALWSAGLPALAVSLGYLKRAWNIDGGA